MGQQVAQLHDRYMMVVVMVVMMIMMNLLKFWEFDLGQFRQFLKTV
jgi:hypothetical protein